MANIKGKVEAGFRIQFTIDGDEARALDAMAGYGDDAFVKAFYEHLGKSYMQKHEEGLRRFLISIRESIGPILGKMQRIDEIVNEVNRGAR